MGVLKQHKTSLMDFGPISSIVKSRGKSQYFSSRRLVTFGQYLYMRGLGQIPQSLRWIFKMLCPVTSPIQTVTSIYKQLRHLYKYNFAIIHYKNYSTLRKIECQNQGDRSINTAVIFVCAFCARVL
jgi:hypothetical protein